MSEAKKYFWLKLKRDFFKRHDIQIIEAMPNGKDYILFYLKLLCESVDHEGKLRFSEQIPYNEQMLATITNTNVDVVRSAIEAFTQLHMMEMLDDGTYFMSEVDKMIGSTSQDEYTRESTRLRVQRYRERQKALPDKENRYSNVTCNGEIELEKEKELEKDIEIEKETDIYGSVLSLYHSICKSYPDCPSLTETHKQRIDYLMQTYNLGDFVAMFKKAEASRFLKGDNERKWSACLGWMIKDHNMQKILNGEYD